MTHHREEQVPVWNGNEASLDHFATECHQYVDTVEYKKRYLCGPRVARKLTGKAKTALIGRRPGWLNNDEGVTKLLDLLRGKVLKGAVPDLGYYMDEFLL